MNIEELYESGRISTRTHNCLKSAGWQTLEQVVQAISSDDDLLRLKGFGRKSLRELSPLLEQARVLSGDDVPTSVRQGTIPFVQTDYFSPAYETAVAGDDEVAHFLRTVYPTPARLHAAILGDGERLMKRFSSSNAQDNRRLTVSLRQRYRQFIADVLAADEGINELPVAVRNCYTARLTMLDERMDEYTVSDRLADMQPCRRAYLDELFKQACTDSPCRSRQLMARYMPRLEDALTFNPDARGQRLQVTQAAAVVKEQMTQQVTRIADMTDEEFLNERTQTRHPFLNTGECRFVAGYSLQYGHEPCFFLLYRYMLTTRDKRNRMYNMLHGIGCQPLSVDGIAQSYGLSRERARQVTVDLSGLPVLKTSYITSDEWLCYETLWDEPLIGEHTPALVDILQREQLHDYQGDKLLPLLSRLAVGGGLTCISVEHKTLLINNALCAADDVRRMAEAVKQCLLGRYTTDERVAISYIAAALGRHRQPLARKWIAYMAEHIFHLPVDVGHIVLKQNFVDVSSELQIILTAAGKPLTLQELFDAFNRRNPRHRYNGADPKKIVPYIVKNKQILPIGRTGRYALKEWNVNTLTIRDIIRQTLQAADGPLHTDTLLKAVTQHYPNTTINSLTASMSSGEFVNCGKGYYGLANKTDKKQDT